MNTSFFLPLLPENHFSDYIPTANLVVRGDALETLEDLTPDACTAKCTASPECRSVNYCHKSARVEKTTCSLMSLSPSAPDVHGSRQSGCWNYRRQSVGAELPHHPPPPPPGYMGARLTWLVIGMIVTGAVIGAAGLLAYGYWSGRSGRNASGGGLGLAIPSVRWSRQRDEE